MACSAVPTVGASNANTYCTIAEANAFFDLSPYPGIWTAVGTTDDQRCRALVTATRLLDEQWDWFGYATTLTQRLLWPRAGMIDRKMNSVPIDVLPEDLKIATALLAKTLLDSDVTADNAVNTQGISRVKAGPVEVEFKETIGAKILPDEVIFMLDHFGRARRPQGRDGMIPLERG